MTGGGKKSKGGRGEIGATVFWRKVERRARGVSRRGKRQRGVRQMGRAGGGTKEEKDVASGNPPCNERREIGDVMEQRVLVSGMGWVWMDGKDDGWLERRHAGDAEDYSKDRPTVGRAAARSRFGPSPGGYQLANGGC